MGCEVVGDEIEAVGTDEGSATTGKDLRIDGYDEETLFGGVEEVDLYLDMYCELPCPR